MQSQRFLLPLLLILMVALIALVTSACSASTASVNGPILLPPLPQSVKSCERPLLLPETALTRSQVEQLWARDRSNLVKCGATLETLITHYDALASDLRNAAQ